MMAGACGRLDFALLWHQAMIFEIPMLILPSYTPFPVIDDIIVGDYRLLGSFQ